MEGTESEKRPLWNDYKKAIPRLAQTGNWVFKKCKLPELQDSRHMKVVRLSAL